MKKGRRGFTLIEVAIFLAITGALFVSVTVGVQNSIYQQRVNDSVQNFAEFLRGVYAEVTNVQNPGMQNVEAGEGNNNGRSNQAIYGKLITFGESRNLAGEEINGGNPSNEAFVYSVVGKVLEESDSTSGGILQILQRLGASVAILKTDDRGDKEVSLAGLAESYTPRWAAEIEPACGNGDCSWTYDQPLQGTVLIVRHPSSGVVYTYYMDKTIQVNEKMQWLERDENVEQVNLTLAEMCKEYPSDTGCFSDFTQQDIDFCINPDPGVVTLRRDVRIDKGARNASGVVIVSDDESRCR